MSADPPRSREGAATLVAGWNTKDQTDRDACAAAGLARSFVRSVGAEATAAVAVAAAAIGVGWWAWSMMGVVLEETSRLAVELQNLGRRQIK